MLKVVFIQDIWYEVPAVMQLSAIIRRDFPNCLVSVIISPDPVKAARQVLILNPDVALFSLVTEQTLWASKVARIIKKNNPGLPIVAGGIHPTVFSGLLASAENEFDFAVRGEADLIISRLIESLATENWNIARELPGVVSRQKFQLVFNPLSDLVEDLDSLPDMDREVYYRDYSFLSQNPLKIAMGSRGCPENCSFCFSSTLRKLYSGKGKYVRYRSPERLINELEMLYFRWGFEVIRFYDDILCANPDWFEQFCRLYQRRINKPYIAYGRAEYLNEDIVKLLAYSGCRQIHMGVEAGGEDYRFRVLNKRITDQQLLRAADLLHKYRIELRTTQMFSLPGQNFELAWQTLMLNRKLRPQSTWAGIFQPFPGLPLTENARKNGMLKRSQIIWNSHLTNSLNQIDKREVENLHKLFYLAIKAPEFLLPLLKRVCRWPLDGVYFWLYILSYGWVYWEQTRVSLFRLFKDGLKLLPFFLKRH